jgi:hypothetical protein
MTERDDDDANEPASPSCSARTADPAYMGFATTAEVADFLNVLLEAERAGARVTLESARAATGARADLLRDIHRDEARWCAMLSEELARLAAPASTATGAFYGKAMAIADMAERLTFLNRGQGWVVRKLSEMLPRIGDDRLHARLRDMRDSHVANIARASQS